MDGAGRAMDEDRALLERLRSGPARGDAMAQILERHAERTYAFFRARVGDPEIAAELNQELYLALLDSLRSFRGECSLETWLFRLARWRLAKLRRRWSVHTDESAPRPLEAVAERVPVPGLEPDERAARSERIRRLRDCLARLPEIERAVVVAHYYEGQTLDEVTRRLGLTNPSGARAVLLAAQRHLRACLHRKERAGRCAKRRRTG
ncbi:MAG: sigma-70 family RNA polymerase sigma factor [Acidobacteria bacterium]|nr:MAG: sigma-70 family RNA polymerase sigma factor [Acidobacteriota bacterium]